jgi:hypothetical protein
VILVGAMGEVEAGNVHASPQQFLNNLHCARCWPQSAHHLRPAAGNQVKKSPGAAFARAIATSFSTLVLHTEEGVPANTASRPSCTILLNADTAGPKRCQPIKIADTSHSSLSSLSAPSAHPGSSTLP